MRKLLALLLLSASAFGTTVTGVKDIKTAGGVSFTGKILLGLNVAGAQDSCTGTAIVQGYVTINVLNGSVVGSPFVSGNDCIAPQGTVYVAEWRDPYNNVKMQNAYLITGATFDIGAAVPLPLTTSNVSAMDLLGIRTLTVTGNGGITNSGDYINTALATIKWGSSGTSSPDVGLSRCGVNTLCLGNATQGNTAGILKTQTISIPTATNTLPATITNDASGGVNLTSNGGKTWEITNGGTLSSPPIALPIQLNGTTSGQVFLAVPAIAGGNTWTIPAATDTAVGKATTDVLQNKDLRNTGSGNSVTLLNSQDTLGAVTGTAGDNTLYTFTIPANTIQAGKGFRIRMHAISNNAVNVVYKLTIGSTTQSLGTSTGNSNVDVQLEVFNNAGVQNAQRGMGFGLEGLAFIFNTTFTMAENFANALVVKITANEANPNTVTPDKWFIELIQ